MAAPTNQVMDVDRFLGGNAPIGSEPQQLPISDAFRKRLEAKWDGDKAEQADMVGLSCQLIVHSMVSLFIGCVGMIPGACRSRAARQTPQTRNKLLYSQMWATSTS